VLGLFHFGLRTRGLLFLGPSETLGKLEDEFEPLSREAKIYSKRRDLRLMSHSSLTKLEGRQRRQRNNERAVADATDPNLYETLLDRYMPTAFLLNERFQIVHCFRGAEKLLAIRSGRLSTALTGLLEGRLRTAVSGLLDRYKQERGGVHSVNLRGVAGDESYTITVSPVQAKRSAVTNVLVELRALESQPERGAEPPADATAVAAEYVEALERDLEFARGELQSTVEELEAANEELQAANEELIASNEELQSTNEELRSVNEELNNVNSDHQQKISDLIEVTDDLENLLHTINVGVLFLDSSLCIRRANRRIGELLHILPQDVGRSFSHFKNNLDAPEAFATVRKVLESGEPAEQETRTASGIHLLWTVMPYSSRMGTPGVVLTIIDISSRRAAESEARRLSAIVRTARDAIISYSLDGQILSWNAGAERLFGHREQEAVGSNLRLIVPDELAVETERTLVETRAGNDVPPFETTRIARDGSRLEVLLSVAPIRSGQGNVTGASMIAIDITARKHAEERAAIAIEQREKFLALLSHELRNPLMAISSANEVLARSNEVTDVTRRAQQVISRQVKQMSRLLEDTLDASRMRHDKIELHRKRVDLRLILEAALDATRPRAAREGVELEVSIPDEPVFVRADITRLQQVIVNLTQNAINHSKEGDTIRLRVSVEAENAIVLITDEGDGIPPEALSQLFEPFFQASRRSRAGLGLGLSLARSIARAHGGDITAASDGIGKGASFEVRLPIVDESTETGIDLAAALAGRTGTPAIVLVDDDAEGRSSLGLLLQTAGYEVFEAGDGTSGLQLIEKEQPSVAVLDIGLPDISGLEVARRVRRKFGPNKIRLIALTGFGRQDDREAAVEAGCDMHLVKPIDFATLERVIAYQVSR
jgi:two-component system CheB/CheR fusion protein